jgi:hypothetical protein
MGIEVSAGGLTPVVGVVATGVVLTATVGVAAEPPQPTRAAGTMAARAREAARRYFLGAIRCVSPSVT